VPRRTAPHRRLYFRNDAAAKISALCLFPSSFSTLRREIRDPPPFCTLSLPQYFHISTPLYLFFSVCVFMSRRLCRQCTIMLVCKSYYHLCAKPSSTFISLYTIMHKLWGGGNKDSKAKRGSLFSRQSPRRTARHTALLFHFFYFFSVNLRLYLCFFSPVITVPIAVITVYSYLDSAFP